MKNRIIEFALIIVLIAFSFTNNILDTFAACITGTPTLTCGPKSNGYCENIPGGSQGDSGGYNCANYIACGGGRGCYHHFYVCNTPCGSGSSSTPLQCKAEDKCTPSCPVGMSKYNLGGSSKTESCSYKTGKVKANGNCDIDTNTISCYSKTNTPTVTITVLNGNTSIYGCRLSDGYIGNSIGNRVNVVTSYPQSQTPTDQMTALVSWHGPSDPNSIGYVRQNGTKKLANNNSFGILVRKVNGIWSSVYVPGYYNGLQSWIYAGTVSSDIPSVIYGTTEKKLADVKNITVTETETTITLSYDIEFITTKSGLAPNTYEVVGNGVKNIYADAYTKSTFVTEPNGVTIINPLVPRYTGRFYKVDMNDPVVDGVTTSFTGLSELSINWLFSEEVGESGISRVIGDASILKAGSTNGPVDDLTSGITNYVLGSGATGLNLFSGLPHLWIANNINSRVDRIDLKNNSGGSLSFTIFAFDKACNYTSTTKVVSLGNSWMLTKGGLVYSFGGSNFDIPILNEHKTFSPDLYWNSPFAIYKDEGDITTELVSASTANVNTLLHPTKGTTRSLNHFDTNNMQNYWFDELKRRVNLEIFRKPAIFDVVNFSDNLAVNVRSTDISDGRNKCSTNKLCVINIGSDLIVNSGFVCNTKTAFIVEGKIFLKPDIVSNMSKNGCIFLSKDDVTIEAGTYKSGSSTYPIYDILEGLIITDGKIIIPYVDEARNIRDGLLIHGSLISFSSNSPSIEQKRSLRLLHNQTFPAVAIHFDNRFLGIATEFFGGDNDGFKREVGLKQ